MKASLALALHFHQPTGNFDHVIKRACDKCYMPFLEMIKRFPEIKINLHFTGCLLEWAEENRPEMLKMVREMAASGQAELLSGGFYEPILISIPPEDRRRQIDMLTRYIKEKFSYEAKGAWVAERIWEPVLASTFNEAGIKYIILDDTHFLYAGVPKEKTYGYYMTEDNGKTLAVFPSDKVLRYSIPYKMPHECTAYMRGVSEREPGSLFVYGDDAEKFGEWPGTYKWVYEEKWLENFFNELMASKDWLQTVKLSDCLESRKPEGRVYIPAASYEEMLQWSLPSDVQEVMEDVISDIQANGKEDFYRPFIRGGFWRNFLSKYPESNQMNKKMLYVSGKLESLRDSNQKNKALLEAEKELFKGQCNCAYWHGVFGGLYLYHLRNAVYGHLIKSEAIIDKALYGKKQIPRFQEIDVDADGLDEVILENGDISLYFAPEEGGVLKEFDSKKVSQNFINTLTRRKEAYHRKIIKKLQEGFNKENNDEVKTIHDGIKVVDEELKDQLNYDWYGRYCLVDHFMSEDVSIKDFMKCKYNEIGDFVKGAYQKRVEKSVDGLDLIMERQGSVGDSRVEVIKRIKFPTKGGNFEAEYTITNIGDNTSEFVFGAEFNITMPSADSDKYKVISDKEEASHLLGDVFEVVGSRKMEVRDAEAHASLIFEFSDECSIWHFPINTVSQSEKAYELNYQGSSIFPHQKMSLKAGQTKELTIKVLLKV